MNFDKYLEAETAKYLEKYDVEPSEVEELAQFEAYIEDLMKILEVDYPEELVKLDEITQEECDRFNNLNIK